LCRADRSRRFFNARAGDYSHVPQHTGMPPKLMQQMQPACMHLCWQSQQAWIMLAQCLSPLVQWISTPSAELTHLQLHIAKLHWQVCMPFIRQQQLHSPSHNMRHMFCSVAAIVSSSHVQQIFVPPVIFSNLISQRGTMHRFDAEGNVAGAPMAPAGWIALDPDTNDRSNNIVLDMTSLLCVAA